jgi:outer membrane immunogenic protein
LLAVAGPTWAAEHDWRGFYIGGNGGYGWGVADTNTTITDGALLLCHFCDNIFGGGPTTDHLIAQDAGSPLLHPKGFTGGAQFGFNWQTGFLVYGGELEFGAFDQHQTINNSFVLPGNTALIGGGGVCGATGPETCIGNFTTTVKTEWLFTLRPRIGYAWDATLTYVTGGLAITRLKFSQTYSDNITYPLVPGSTGAGGSERASAAATKAGFVVGTGFEQAVDAKWSFKAEYLYMRFAGLNAAGALTDGFGGTAGLANRVEHLSSNVVRAGLNYRFGR